MQTIHVGIFCVAQLLKVTLGHPAAHIEYHDRVHSFTTRSANRYTDSMGNTESNAIRLADEIGAHPYTMEFLSTASDPRNLIVWNKVGPSGANSGSFHPPAANFTLEPGESQIVVFEPNTQGGFCDFTEQKKTRNGQYDCPYGEFNIAPLQNDGEGAGWSAADVSTYNQDPAPEGRQIGVGRPCNLNIGAEGGTGNSTCHDNYYWAAAGTFGLEDNIGVVVPSSEEAHFQTIVSDMKVAS